MPLTRKAELRHVGRCGARAGSVLRGATLHNTGLRLRVTQAQGRGAQGPIRGPFVILDAGNNMHSHALEGLLGVVTDSGGVLRAIRPGRPSCVSVVNTNLLVPEDPGEPAASGDARGREGVVSDPDF